MDHFHGIYWLKCDGKSMYAGVYTSPQNIDFDLNITRLLNKLLGNESCYPCGQPDPSKKVTGWVGIHFNRKKMEIQITIYGDCNTPHQKLLLEKSLPTTYNDSI